ncbi:hypothetical protein [Helicobacter sp. T3_23-1056]
MFLSLNKFALPSLRADFVKSAWQSTHSVIARFCASKIVAIHNHKSPNNAFCDF